MRRSCSWCGIEAVWEARRFGPDHPDLGAKAACNDHREALQEWIAKTNLESRLTMAPLFGGGGVRT